MRRPFVMFVNFFFLLNLFYKYDIKLIKKIEIEKEIDFWRKEWSSKMTYS